jgi:hypothetical protein
MMNDPMTRKSLLALLLVVSLTAFSGCNSSDSSSGANSDNPNVGQNTKNANSPATCEYQEVAVPDLFKAIAVSDGNSHDNDTAFQTPSCKIVAIGALTDNLFHFARFQDGKFDSTFGTNGQLDVSFLGVPDVELHSLKTVAFGQKVFLAGIDWWEDHWSGEVFGSLLDAEGNFTPTPNSNLTSFLFKGFPNCRSSAGETDCMDLEQFKILSMVVQGTSVSIDVSYFNLVHQATEDFQATLDLTQLGK